MKKSDIFIDVLSRQGYWFFLIFIIVVSFLFTPNFLRLGTLNNILIQMTPVLITGLAMTVAISSGGIDISMGSAMAIVSMVMSKTFSIGIFQGILVGLLVGVLLGLFNGLIIAFFKVEPIILTLMVMIGGRGIAQVLNGGKVFIFYEPTFTNWIVKRFFGVVPMQTIIMAIAVAGIYFCVRRTTFGVYIQALGDNHAATRMAGIHTVIITVAVYVLCGFMAAIAGVLETARLTISDASQMGLGIEMDAIVTVALGGTPMTGGVANIVGTVVGCVIIQMITVIINMNNLSTAYAYIIKAIVLILAVFIQNLNKVNK